MTRKTLKFRDGSSIVLYRVDGKRSVWYAGRGCAMKALSYAIKSGKI